MSRMKNKTKLYMVLLTLGIILFVLGVLTGILIGSISAGKKAGNDEAQEEKQETVNEAASVSRPMVIVSDKEAPNVTNVYIPARERVLGQIPINSYKLDNFYIEDGFMAYHDDEGNKLSHLGIDLSYHQ